MKNPEKFMLFLFPLISLSLMLGGVIILWLFTSIVPNVMPSLMNHT